MSAAQEGGMRQKVLSSKGNPRLDNINSDIAGDGMAALRWLVEGYGYEITSVDVLDAYSHTMRAAQNIERADETQKRIHDLVARGDLR